MSVYLQVTKSEQHNIYMYMYLWNVYARSSFLLSHRNEGPGISLPNSRLTVLSIKYEIHAGGETTIDPVGVDLMRIDLVGVSYPYKECKLRSTIRTGFNCVV